MKNKRQIALLVACVVTFMGVIHPNSTLAASQEALNQAQQQKASSETTLQDTRNLISNLENKRDESETYLTELNNQLLELKSSLEDLNSQYVTKQAELVTVTQELETAKQTEITQYADMKVRIRYMYENSEAGALETLLSSDNFSDFLSRAQNMTDISDYDRKMLDQYEETKNQIADKEQTIKEEQQAIADIQTKSLEKQTQIQEIYSATYNQLLTYESDITDAESTSASLLANIRAQEDSINELMVKARNEELERQKAETARLAAEAQAKAAKQAAEEAQAQAQTDAANAAAAEEAANAAAAAQAAANAAASQQASEQSTSNSNSESQGSTVEDSSSNSSEQPSGSALLGRFTITAYCPCSICCGSHAGGPTASGAMPTAGRTVAMGGVPFGTKLRINGQIYTVEDRGTAYGHVDIYFNTHAEALAFGMRYIDVYQA